MQPVSLLFSRSSKAIRSVMRTNSLCKNATSMVSVSKVFSVPMDFSGIQQGMDLCRTNIIIGHSLASPMIAGLPSMGGLGNDGSALTLATEVWMKTQILPARARLIKIFEELFALAGYETEIIIENYKLFI